MGGQMGGQMGGHHFGGYQVEKYVMGGHFLRNGWTKIGINKCVKNIVNIQYYMVKCKNVGL
jgi:hypothetical protein